ncbi:hypothetical protein CspeluHIS016_0406700 [Cutaneotrichosporon spelunceum]|uniref:WAC domain-containing protein n=1 Tax=Cutaneotrichosporon spelunceum TaxID=1672016 RepID=A0AAD3TVX1_9TREE|nr:hypothetical protein CspeluHIS016_0406700 [Cutaneotrichosporon spelunceum]
MPLLKRKPVHMHPLPSLSTIVQPINTAQAESSPTTSAPGSEAPDQHLKDLGDDDAQLDKLISVLHDPTLSAPAPKKPRGSLLANGAPNGAGQPPPGRGAPVPGYRVKNVDCFYLPETGEIFLDYETYAQRRAFYDQQVFQCEVTGKSALSYFDALYNEQREVKQLHARFPRPLKKAVLQSVHFQVEGKLDTLADKVYDRFHNRFFDDEKVFVDVQGDKYLARVVKTFPPKDLKPPPGGSPFHPYAMDLNMEPEDVIEVDDPMKYFYQVRLIEEGGEGEHAGSPQENEGDEKWGGSVMEVQADKISRDRINYSRAMLKRFIRDCVSRDAAIYSPWIVKKPIALRYGLPTEMTDELRAAIIAHREAQMDRRKRDREGRLGITHDDEETESEQPPKKKRSSKGLSKEDRDRIKQEEKEAEEKEQEEVKKKVSRGIKYPIEDFLLEYQEKDRQAGRVEVKPVPNRDLPFGDQFDKFLMVWSFLNVMGKPLGISSFTIDDFEQSLYHNDQWSTVPPLLVEIHSVLIKALANDLKAGNDPVLPLQYTGMVPENDIDYWEGTKGATAETLRPVVGPMAESWAKKDLSVRDSRRGWEHALIGCLWDRATLEAFPSYLDLILFLTFENKPAPTRPTWSTGPSQNTATGLIPAKSEKRYNQLHFTQKLDIIDFIIELVAQTGVIRDFMEDATSELTEVRKKQQEARRDYKRVRTEREALEPKDEKKDDEDGEVKDEPSESRLQSPNGHANGTATNTERDELDSAAGDESPSRVSSPIPERGHTSASRRRAMRERAAEREAEEAMKAAAAAKERQEVKAARAEARQLAADRKRLEDEETALEIKLHEIERDFRRHLYTLRARPLGVDRWHNRVWWLDGLGSAPLLNDGKVLWGTGRLYIQGAEDLDIELSRRGLPHATQGLGVEKSAAEIASKRATEEGEAKLAPGEWAVYDTPEQLQQFYNWLNPRGRRDLDLHRTLKMWWTELEGGFHRRRIQTGLEAAPEEPTQRRTRRIAGEEEREGYMGWRNKRATGK